MYRPNRIGPWTIANPNKSLVVLNYANFDIRDTGKYAPSTFSLNAATTEQFMGESFIFDSSPTLATDMQVGLGVQVSGNDTDVQNYQYGITGTLTWYGTQKALIECMVSRLTAAPSNILGIAVEAPMSLPINYTSDGELNIATINQALVTQSDLDGGTLPTTIFDIAAFWRIINETGATLTLKGLSGRIALHKYAIDLKTADPTR